MSETIKPSSIVIIRPAFCANDTSCVTMTIAEELGIKLTGKVWKAMQGLVEEGKEVLEDYGQSAVIDAADRTVSVFPRFALRELSAADRMQALLNAGLFHN